MKLVLDSNILFSLMNPNSTASFLFFSLNSKFIAPEFIKSEFEKHKKVCLLKSKLSLQEFKSRLKQIEESVRFINELEYKHFFKTAKKSISDEKDIDFLALALSTNSVIWSNVKHLKEQSLIPVLTTEELIKLSS